MASWRIEFHTGNIDPHTEGTEDTESLDFNPFISVSVSSVPLCVRFLTGMIHKSGH